MAIAVPLIMAYAGATATTIAFTTMALAVTGVNSKIDKAASNVFGDDLVKVANIAGAAFMAWNAFGAGIGEAAAGEATGEFVGDLAGRSALSAADAAAQGSAAGQSLGGSGILANAAAEGAAQAPGATPDMGPAMAASADSSQVAANAAGAGRAGVAAGEPTGQAVGQAAALRPGETRVAPVTKQPGAPAQGLEWLSQQWANSTPQTKIIFGNMLLGGMQSYAQARAQDKEREAREAAERERRGIMQSGSGLRLGQNYTYGRPGG